MARAKSGGLFRTAVNSSVVFGLLSAGPAMSQPASQANATPPTPIHVVGTLILNITLYVSAATANGASVYVSANAFTADSYYGNGNTPSGTGTVVDRQVVVTLTFPYKWTVASTSEKVTISVFASGAGTGAYSDIGNTDALQTQIALPANGATTTVDLTGSI